MKTAQMTRSTMRTTLKTTSTSSQGAFALPHRPKRVALVIQVQAGSQPSQSPSTQNTPRRKRVLPLLSELVDVQANSTRFETIAGRSAMLGFMVAAVSESFTAKGIFDASTVDAASSLAVFGSGLVLAAALFGAAYVLRGGSLRQKLGRRLLEPVLASLTSRTRSGGSVSGKDVDGALDVTMDAVFTATVLASFISSMDGSINDVEV